MQIPFNVFSWLRAWLHTDRPTRRRLGAYPSNHSYLIDRGTLVPGPRLHQRWAKIAALYPEPLISLLDVGSCKGYFVMEAANRPTCQRAMGIDVVEPFISLARDIAAQTGQTKARFERMGLDELAKQKELFGAPFQTVLLLNVYHYLFWGSELSPLAFNSHRRILQLLNELCQDRVIFSSPLELSECPGQVQRAARGHSQASTYTRAGFIDAASEFFAVTDHGRWGRRPLLVLQKRIA